MNASMTAPQLRSLARRVLSAVLLLCLLWHPTTPASRAEILPPAAHQTRPVLTPQIGHSGEVFSVSFSPDGKQILTAGVDKTAKIWDSATGILLHTFIGHGKLVHSAVFSRDGKLIVTASADETAKVWDSVNGNLLRTINIDGGDLYSATVTTQVFFAFF